MIPAKELRIGNLIYQPNGEITKVGYEVIRILIITDTPPDYQPIPLTPEILEKAGFNRDKEGWYLSAENKLYDPLQKNGAGTYSQQNTNIFAFKHGSNILSRGVKYLHQLQNLYFALTGVELTIELNAP